MCLFQRATRGIENVVYKTLIAPFKDNMPTSDLDGFTRICADQKYAYIGPDIVDKYFSRTVSCQLVQLPDTSYLDTLAFIISKNSPYKGLINWRWDNESLRRFLNVIYFVFLAKY
jgi:hypothetical protein